jgi:deoxyribodipyrimidine photolyase-related protein
LQLLFADQLGPHFIVDQKILLPELLSQFKKREYHRQKAHLILYAIRSRAQDPGVELVSIDNYRSLKERSDLTVAVNPTSYALRRLVDSLGVQVVQSRGFCSSEQQFADFASVGKQLRLENFYRMQRKRLGLLMQGDEPEGGRWNFDSDNRLPPPKQGLGLPEPYWPEQDALDEEVRATLDELEGQGVRFRGEDGPRRFAGNREQALRALDDFIENRLDLFGPYEDAIDSNDSWMAHSMLSAPMNLGLLDPLEVARAAQEAYLAGKARLESVEGFIRQVIGWRDYVWHLYWHFGEDYTELNRLGAAISVPESWKRLDGDQISAQCLSSTIGEVAKNGWAHHIPRLMILGNIALQRGYNPREVNDWFIDSFVDGTPWVMPANVIGMSLYADGGQMSTKPYAAGGAYIDRMSNHCGSCRFNPKKRVGEDACPITAGYWFFMESNRQSLKSNFRLRNAYAGLSRLTDLEALMEQELNRKRL